MNGTLATPLYTPAQLARRDATRWTLVQGVLAPIQFMVFLASLALVIRFLATGAGLGLTEASLIAKVGMLYLIMTTGCFWERAVFGRFLFARAFFWEDVIGMGVIALHTAALCACVFHLCAARGIMGLTLGAYAGYLVNAGQFVLKLRRARMARRGPVASSTPTAARPMPEAA